MFICFWQRGALQLFSFAFFCMYKIVALHCTGWAFLLSCLCNILYTMFDWNAGLMAQKLPDSAFTLSLVIVTLRNGMAAGEHPRTRLSQMWWDLARPGLAADSHHGLHQLKEPPAYLQQKLAPLAPQSESSSAFACTSSHMLCGYSKDSWWFILADAKIGALYFMQLWDNESRYENFRFCSVALI